MTGRRSSISFINRRTRRRRCGESSTRSAFVCSSFRSWIIDFWWDASSVTLPYLQLSPVVKRPPGYLVGSLRSYFEVRKGMPVPLPPPPMRTGVMGLWHNVMSRNV